jgi:hypothetical protein
MSPALPAPSLIDAHAHLHRCFDAGRWLSAAADAFGAAATELALAPPMTGILLLADHRGAEGFSRLLHTEPLGWQLQRTGCGLALRGIDSQRRRMMIVAGAQIRTAERLEVLGLLTSAAIPDGLEFEAAVRRVLDAGGVPVVPWGFGKWTLRRGTLLRAALKRGEPRFLLGDNGGRFRLWTPRLFHEAARCGIPVLPGSDPLPFPDHQDRAGSSGFVAPLTSSEDGLVADLRGWLLALRSQPVTWGRARAPHAFVHDQIRMQLRRPRQGMRSSQEDGSA